MKTSTAVRVSIEAIHADDKANAACGRGGTDENKMRHPEADAAGRSPRRHPPRARVPAAAVGPLVLGAALMPAAGAAQDPLIPAGFQGAWSTQLEYCGKDSDGNYTIHPDSIDAWEVSWDGVRILSRTPDLLRLRATHREYENTFPVKLTLTRTGADAITVQECHGEYCWQIELRRCPDSKKTVTLWKRIGLAPRGRTLMPCLHSARWRRAAVVSGIAVAKASVYRQPSARAERAR